VEIHFFSDLIPSLANTQFIISCALSMTYFVLPLPFYKNMPCLCIGDFDKPKIKSKISAFHLIANIDLSYFIRIQFRHYKMEIKILAGPYSAYATVISWYHQYQSFKYRTLLIFKK
jgi:hypothetical protein